MTPETTDPRIPPRDHVVSRYLIDRWAKAQPEKTFLKFDDADHPTGGEEWSYLAFRQRVIPTFSEADSFLGFPKRSISESMSRTAWRLVWEQRFRFGRTTVRMT
jgi:hypothetical protein